MKLIRENGVVISLGTIIEIFFYNGKMSNPALDCKWYANRNTVMWSWIALVTALRTFDVLCFVHVSYLVTFHPFPQWLGDRYLYIMNEIICLLKNVFLDWQHTLVEVWVYTYDKKLVQIFKKIHCCQVFV